MGETVKDYLDREDKEPYYDARADIEAEQRAIDEQASKEIEEYERDLIENPYMIKTANGFDVVSILPAPDGTDNAIIFRKTQEKKDYIIARNYNVKDGTWAQGYYDYPTLDEAMRDYTKKYQDKPVKTQKERRQMNNSVILQGTVAEELQAKTSKNGKKYIIIPLELEKEYNGKVSKQIFNVSMFGDKVDKATQFRKGDSVLIKGRLYNNKYKDKTLLAVVGNEIEKGDVGFKNTFKISGFINNKTLEVKTSDNGKKHLTLALSVKDENGKNYETFFVSVFGQTAETVAKFQHRDLVELQGSVLQNDKGEFYALAIRSELVRHGVKVTTTTDTQRSNSNVDEYGKI